VSLCILVLLCLLVYLFIYLNTENCRAAAPQLRQIVPRLPPIHASRLPLHLKLFFGKLYTTNFPTPYSPHVCSWALAYSHSDRRVCGTLPHGSDTHCSVNKQAILGTDCDDLWLVHTKVFSPPMQANHLPWFPEAASSTRSPCQRSTSYARRVVTRNHHPSPGWMYCKRTVDLAIDNHLLNYHCRVILYWRLTFLISLMFSGITTTWPPCAVPKWLFFKTNYSSSCSLSMVISGIPQTVFLLRHCIGCELGPLSSWRLTICHRWFFVWHVDNTIAWTGCSQLSERKIVHAGFPMFRICCEWSVPFLASMEYTRSFKTCTNISQLHFIHGLVILQCNRFEQIRGTVPEVCLPQLKIVGRNPYSMPYYYYLLTMELRFHSVILWLRSW